MSAWNAMSSVTYDALSSSTSPAAPTASGGTAAVSGTSLLQQQTLASYDATDVASSASTSTTAAAVYRTVSSNCVNWVDFTTGCNTGTGQYGWYIALGQGYANGNDPDYLTSSTSTGAQQVDEQIVYSPTVQDGAFLVNTTIPPTNSLNTCSSTLAGGWTMAINPATGGAFTSSVFTLNGQFTNIGTQVVSGLATSGTGTPSVVQYNGQSYVVTQTVPGSSEPGGGTNTNGSGGTGTGNGNGNGVGSGWIGQANFPGASIGSRLTWIQKR
jgi:type IV pilus assembly protein PilY1